MATGKKNNNKVSEDAAGSSNEPAARPPFLGRELRVELKDGRVVVGVLLAYQGSGDLLLQRVVEQRRLKDGFVTLRRLNLLAVPFKHVAKLQRRKDGEAPIYSALEEEGEQPATAVTA